MIQTAATPGIAAAGLGAAAPAGGPAHRTVYGLAADADNDAAVAQIFAARAGRATTPDRACGQCRGPSRISPGRAAVRPGAGRRVLAGGRSRSSCRRLPGRAAPPAGRTAWGLRCPAHPWPTCCWPAQRRGPSGAWRPQRQPVWPRQPHHRQHVQESLATTCWCWTAGPAAWGLNRPSSTARAACPCCCAGRHHAGADCSSLHRPPLSKNLPAPRPRLGHAGGPLRASAKRCG